MKKILSLFLLLWISSGSKVFSQTNGKINEDNETVLRLEPGINNPRNSEGDFITLSDGRILFIYSHFTGNAGDDNGKAYLAACYSDDHGKTWNKEARPVVKQEGNMNVMSVSLLRLHNGEIALFYLRKNSMDDCVPMMRISRDEAKTWSDPVSCIRDRRGYFILNNNRVIQLKTGRLLMAVALHKVPGDDKWLNNAKLFSYYSDDNGHSWHSGKEVPDPGEVIMQEPGVVELRNGNILMFIRTHSGFQYLSYSKDKGETWSTAERSNIKSPLSPASITRIPATGDLLMLWNNNWADQKRTPLNIAVSTDEGKTWSHIKTLEDDPDKMYCYTAIHFTGDHILLGYCAAGQSKWGMLSETDIRRLNVGGIYK